MIPGGWGGENEILLFAAIGRRLETDRPIFAVRSRALDPDWPASSTLEAHASAIDHEACQVSASKGCHLVGECVAGVIALALAGQAEARGFPAGSVVLLDPWMPPQSSWWSVLLRSLTGKNGDKPAPAASTDDSPPPPRIEAYYRLLKHAKPAAIGGDIHLVLVSEGNSPRRAVRYWKQFTRGRIHLHMVRGNHETFIREEAAEIISLLNAILLDEAEANLIQSGSCGTSAT
jgi:thioesterase domain-containing protein